MAASALIGAIVGGLFVLQAQRSERKSAMRGGARAVAFEMLGNYIALRAFAESRGSPDFDRIDVSIPTVSRQIFDQQFHRISQLLIFDDLKSVVNPYTMSTSIGSLLSDRLAASPGRLTTQDVTFLKTIAQMFLVGVKTIMAAGVFNRRERASIQNQISEMVDVEDRVRQAVKNPPS